jgi:hypothetical protein
MIRSLCVLAILVSPVLALADEPSPPMGRIIAHARVPNIMGHPETGFVELYEFDMWLNGEGLTEGHVRRCGAPPYEGTTHNGYCPFDLPPGNYAILLHQPEWFCRPAVVPDITVKPGSNPDRDVIPAMDYCCVSGTKFGSWEKPGLPKPWATAKVFHQTFVAKGTSITHAHFKLAGAKAKSARVSIHEVRDGIPPEQWKQVGPERIDPKIGSLNDNWVGWRSGDLPTVPGRHYALRVQGQGEAGENDISMVVHHDAAGPGYDNGTGYADGVAQKYDLYASISSDSDGTVIPYMRVHDVKPGELGGGGTWSQTWVAKGKALAGIDMLVAWSSEQKGVKAEIRIHENDPKGKQIGVAKRAEAAWWGPGYGFLGAAWQPGEVELQPGKTYCAEFVTIPPYKGYSAGVVNDPRNAYPDGNAFRDGKPVPDRDLEMTVVEYAKVEKPRKPAPAYEPKGKNLLVNGNFEGGVVSESDAADPPGWKRWKTADTAFWYGKYGRDGSNASRVIGGSINGTKIDGGFVQAVSGLKSNKRYCLSGWTNSSALTDKRYLSAVGYDPTGQVTDPKARTITWGLTGRLTGKYEQIVLHDIQPQGDSISVWTRGHNQDAGKLVFTVDFDDFSLVEESR